MVCSTWRRPIWNAICPTRRAVCTRPSTRWRPFSTSLGNSSTTVTARPAGPKTTSSSTRSVGVRRSVTAGPRRGPGPCGPSDAVPAHPLLGIGQLAGVLDQEARAAHELVGLLGQDAFGALGAVVGLGDLLVLGLFFFDDQALLEDLVQAGLDVLVVDLLFLLVALLG